MITVTKKFSVEIPQPRSILEYAKKLGFMDEVEKQNSFLVVKKQQEINYIIELPANSSLDDYPRRVLEVLEEFSVITGNDTLRVWSDIMEIEDGNA